MNTVQPSLREISRTTIATFAQHDREQRHRAEADAEQHAHTAARALADRRRAYAELVTMTKAAFEMPPS
jgi:hypothetical protein